jgi:hypothetical protein
VASKSSDSLRPVAAVSHRPNASSRCNFLRVIPEIDVWRAANLTVKRYGDKAFEESIMRANELSAEGNHDGADT